MGRGRMGIEGGDGLQSAWRLWHGLHAKIPLRAIVCCSAAGFTYGEGIDE